VVLRWDTSATVTPKYISWADCKNISTRFHKQWLYWMSVLIRVVSIENYKKLVSLSAVTAVYILREFGIIGYYCNITYNISYEFWHMICDINCQYYFYLIFNIHFCQHYCKYNAQCLWSCIILLILKLSGEAIKYNIEA